MDFINTHKRENIFMSDKEKHQKIKENNENNNEVLKENDKAEAELKKDEQEVEELDEVTKLINENAILRDTVLRKAAEFENYKKRNDVEISNYIKYASESLIRELLPVYDDVNRSVESIEKGETVDFKTLKKGIILIQEKFKKVLESEGLKEIDCLGKEFNVDLSDAMMQVPRNDVKPHTVVDVVEKGYYLKDKVLRHSKVVVSSDKDDDNVEE
jgi:molecular chaperone GrpE